MGLFNQNTPAKLTRIELGFMADFISKIPDLVLEQRNITKEREAYNKNLDNFDENSLDKELEKNDSIKLFCAFIFLLERDYIFCTFNI